MATVSIDYDSHGDVELILEQKDITNQSAQSDQFLALLEQTDGEPSPSRELRRATRCTMVPLGIKVKKFRLRVSSLKLISSSPYFQAMFGGSGFREHRELRENGFVAIELLDPEEDATAMMIVLGILYGNDIEVPMNLDLSTLHRVAVLADKYQWHALVAPYATSWFEKLIESTGLPDTIDENLLWLWIAWLFGMKDHFKSLSNIAQQDASNSINLTDETIRVPSRALRAINEQREAAFQAIEKAMKTFTSHLLDRKSQDEDTFPEQRMLRRMAYGHAIFCSQDLKLGDFAEPDHAGSSIRALKSGIDAFQSVEGFLVKPPGKKAENERHITPGGIWDLKSTLQEAVKNLKMDEWGLDYDDFKPSSRGKRPASDLDLH